MNDRFKFLIISLVFATSFLTILMLMMPPDYVAMPFYRILSNVILTFSNDVNMPLGSYLCEGGKPCTLLDYTHDIKFKTATDNFLYWLKESFMLSLIISALFGTVIYCVTVTTPLFKDIEHYQNTLTRFPEIEAARMEVIFSRKMQTHQELISSYIAAYFEKFEKSERENNKRLIHHIEQKLQNFTPSPDKPKCEAAVPKSNFNF